MAEDQQQAPVPPSSQWVSDIIHTYRPAKVGRSFLLSNYLKTNFNINRLLRRPNLTRAMSLH